MDGVSIRLLEEGDADRIFSPQTRAAAGDWLAGQQRGAYYIAVAVVDGAPVGRAGLNFEGTGLPDTPFLWAAHVEPEWQGRGIGTTLMRHLEDVARARGMRAIRLFVSKENPRAQALYERLGYSVDGEGVDRWSYEDAGETIYVADPCWTMEKVLDLP
jgi:ribosomal protein S18 acetylase RimI-like enzyme